MPRGAGVPTRKSARRKVRATAAAPTGPAATRSGRGRRSGVSRAGKGPRRGDKGLSSAGSSKDAALLLACGSGADCQPKPVDPQVLLFLEAGGVHDPAMHENAHHLIQKLHHNTLCMYPNILISQQRASGRATWVVYLHSLRSTERKVNVDVGLLRTYAKECAARDPTRLLAFPIEKELHGNMIVVNPGLKTIEHFEPHGAHRYDWTAAQSERYNADVARLFKSVFPGYTYVPPTDVCPRMKLGGGHMQGIQTTFNMARPDSIYAGTCVWWSMWFVHVRLSNPTRPVHEVLSVALKALAGRGRTGTGKSIEEFISQFVLHFIGLTQFKVLSNQATYTCPTTSAAKCSRRMKIKYKLDGRVVTKVLETQVPADAVPPTLGSRMMAWFG